MFVHGMKLASKAERLYYVSWNQKILITNVIDESEFTGGEQWRRNNALIRFTISIKIWSV